MCGIAGCLSLAYAPSGNNLAKVRRMIETIRHRGPDGEGFWEPGDAYVCLGHARLAVIDTAETGAQPMHGRNGTTIVSNGEIYNYRELRADAISRGRKFRSGSDTETILSSYEEHGLAFVRYLRGMFAFALWDEPRRRLILARDRFGIKPLYFTQVNEYLYFASEAKALVPFLERNETDPEALLSYLTFQNYLGSRTLFCGIEQVMPGELITFEGGMLRREKYWDVHYDLDFDHTETFFVSRLQELLAESIHLHLRSDVEVGAYLSGGIDSTLIAGLASKETGNRLRAFHGRFRDYSGYDESTFAQSAADEASLDLSIRDLTSNDLETILRKVVYHLDYPVAGPGALPQFLVSELASEHVKVVLGGQGGDEIFGGYARYLIGYLEQSMRAAIDGTHTSGNFVVTLESIIPNLGLLREYQPLLQHFWREGLFGSMDRRYLRLIDRSHDLGQAINWGAFDRESLFDQYLQIFNSASNVRKEAYFDSMTHFDFKTLLPALLQVEDRMSMAHGLESRVPFLDHPLVEFAATIPADIKFKDGQLKRLLKVAFAQTLPPAVLNRRDKMGFPVPLSEWSKGPLAGFFSELVESLRDRNLPYLNRGHLTDLLGTKDRFSRGLWALINLELWLQELGTYSRET